MKIKNPYNAKKILDMYRAIRSAYPENDTCSTREAQDQYRLYCDIGAYHIIKFMETVGWNEYVYELGCGWNGAEEQEIIQKAEKQLETETEKERLMQMYANVATLHCRVWPNDVHGKQADEILKKIDERLKQYHE